MTSSIAPYVPNKHMRLDPARSSFQVQVDNGIEVMSFAVNPDHLKTTSPYFKALFTKQDQVISIPPCFMDLVVRCALDFLQGTPLPQNQDRTFYLSSYLLGHHFQSRELQQESLLYFRVNLDDLQFAEQAYPGSLPDLVSHIPFKDRLELLRHFPDQLVEQINQNKIPLGKALPSLDAKLLSRIENADLTSHPFVEEIKTCPLKHLALSPSSEGHLLKILKYFPSLESLDLSNCNRLDPHSLVFLIFTPNLKKLILKNCPQLSLDALKGLKLEHLDIENHGDVDFTHLPPTLLFLNISGCSQFENPFQDLYRFPRLQHLHARNCRQLALSFLSDVKELKTLDISQSTLVSPFALSHLQFVPKIESLTLESNRLDPNFLQNLPRNLKHLKISDQDIERDSLKYLERAPHLKTLKLSLPRKWSPRALLPLNSLENLYLEDIHEIPEGDWIYLLSSPHLKNLILVGKGQEVNLRFLRGATKLEKMILKNLNLSGFEELPPNLRALALVDCQMRAPIFLREKFRLLEYLKLQRVAPETLQKVTAFRNLKSLWIDLPNIEAHSLRSLDLLERLHCLHLPTKMASLNLSSNKFTIKYIDF